MTLSVLLIIHVLGGVLGVGAATFIEIFLDKSLLDGEIDVTERSFMKTTVTIMRIGLLFSILSGLGLILLFRFNDQIFRLYDPLLWAKFTILFVLMVNAVLIHAHKIPILYGSAISFVSWYSVFILGFLVKGPPFPYMITMLYYVAALAIGGVLLHSVRRMLGITV